MRTARSFAGLLGPVCFAIWLTFILNGLQVSAQQDATCDLGRECAQGCCSKEGSCGFTDAHCGDGCTSNCNATAECGQFALPENRDCPINTCCSKHGYCGTTELFCADGCQKNSNGGGCGSPTRPKCGISTDAKTYTRRIAYYELFTRNNNCNKKEPAELPIGPLTHLNLAFVNFDKNFNLIDDNGEWVSKVVVRKFKYPDLRVNIAIGGWTFNDPPTATYWSDMASTKENRGKFISSVVKYLLNYGLDGVDLDWEYPVAPDRGGKKEDGDNYVKLLEEMRAAFDHENTAWEISVTLPASFWYLKGFKLKEMGKHLSYWNVMTYDIHGMWDKDNEWTGPWLRGHTEWPEIDEGLDLLWRNDIKPKDVVMGFAFYGRSFTMADPNCHEPNRICKFSGGGLAGDCSATEGILTYQELAGRNNTLDVRTYYNKETTVKYNVYGGSQWISYDDAQSFHDKLEHLSERCLSGLMIWAIDQDTSQWDAMSGLFGDYSMTELEGLGKNSAEKLHDLFGQFNGQDCFVTERCTDGSDKQKGDQQVCPDGYGSVETAHSPYQRHGRDLFGTCEKGWFRHICCPKKAMPHNCDWSTSCNVGKCDKGKFKLNTDPFRDAEGNDVCSRGTRTLCCDSTKMFSDCFWTECDGQPRNPWEPPSCPQGFDFVESRLDKADGTRWCSDEYYFEPDNKHGSPLHTQFQSSLCCPSSSGLKNCRWSNNPPGDDPSFAPNMDDICKPQRCRKSEVEVADALDPPESPALGPPGQKGSISCEGFEMPPGFDAHFPLCCPPPDEYNEHWPVDPKSLWKEYWNDPKDSSVAWKFANNHENNNMDLEENKANEESGEDEAYGFMMLDGPKGAIDSKFGSTQTVVRRFKDIPKVKREILTSNHTLIDKVFEHSEEIIHVYCNYPPGSPECDEVFINGAEDTIITIPDHVGEGPFARIVYMRLAAPEFQLPAHHIQHRLEKRLHEHPIYEVKIDYNFHLIEARADSKPVNIRVDYTNLLGYWDELTDSSPSRIKRGLKNEDSLTMHDFRSRVQRGVRADEKAGGKRRRRRSAETVKTTTAFDMDAEELPEDREKRCAAAAAAHADKPIAKRWWGTFVKWLDELTSVREGQRGDLPLQYSDKIKLFEAKWGCPGSNMYANLRMDLEAAASMDAVYAYYLSARFIPPQKPDAFFYFGLEPSAYLGLILKGNAVFQARSNERKIIDTIGYPGLAVKGIAAVGPTLDIYGQIRGKITISGEAKAGARIAFGKAEVYWPQDDDAKNKYDKILGLDLDEEYTKVPMNVEPTFEAGVKLDAQLDILIRPEANVGIKVGGGPLTAGRQLVDAQITAFMLGTLSFQARGLANLVTGKFDYTYGVYLLYNVGFKAKAVILEWKDWAMKPRMAYEPKDRSMTIYQQSGSINLFGNTKRWVTLGDGPQPDFDNNTMSANPAYFLFARADGDGDTDMTDPNSSKFTDQVSCPPGKQIQITLPELRLNCDTMPPRAYGSLGYVSHSFCDGYTSSQMQRGTVLTHDAKSVTSAERRRDQCPSGTCTTLTSLARINSGVSTLKLDCDEFPPASAEEGGLYQYDHGTLCVPSYQNKQHGTCVKMMSSLSSNVGKMEPSVPLKDREDGWATWNDAFWSSGTAVKGSAKQRFSLYSESASGNTDHMPTPAGFTAAAWASSGHDRMESWTFKRNYTFQAVDGTGEDHNAVSYYFWDATGVRVVGNKQLAHPNDRWANIVCAVNIFGQTDFYKEPTTSAGQVYNAYCLVGSKTTNDGWTESYGMARCYVDFGVGVFDKRSESNGDEKEEKWDIRAIQIIDDEVIPVDSAFDSDESEAPKEQASPEAAASSLADQFGDLNLATTRTEDPEPSVNINSGGEGFVNAAIGINKGT
ncbi:hypothetical protein B0H63DRAFT_533483 [Podospora didyma]|uniref:chitinase n=1 Tax=Podospora didyma TaxID=330526 RepID=A0AAE0U8T3_9PEZI|nr:hypothetical protein B0H63DRAFT_533483 [Podospora didyma]